MGVAHILQKNVTHSAAVCVSISRSLIKTHGFAQRIANNMNKSSELNGRSGLVLPPLPENLAEGRVRVCLFGGLGNIGGEVAVRPKALEVLAVMPVE